MIFLLSVVVVLLLAGCVWTGLVCRRLRAELAASVLGALASGRRGDLLSTTLSSIGDGVVVTDNDGKITFLNPVAERLTGWSRVEAAGRRLPEVFRIINETTRRLVENPVEKVFRLGTVVGLANHTILIAKSGAEVPIDDSAAPIRDEAGALFGVILVFRDVTERRAAEEVRARLATIVESSTDPIISKGLDGIIRTWNTGAERLFGYKAAEIVGKPITTLLPPDRLYEEDEIMDRLRHGRPDELMDTVRVTKDGRRINVWVRVSPIFDAEGTVIGAAKHVRDISERKRLEEELRAANSGLERRVAERTAQLERSVDELERFTYSVAHDLRAPLRVIHRYGELLLAKRGTLEDADVRDYLGRVMAGAKRMDALILDLLGYSKVSRTVAAKEPLDAGAVVRETLKEFEASIAERGATVTAAESFPRVLGDRVLLGRVLANLLANALKFVPGGVAPRVEIGAETVEGRVRLWVRDNGLGIDPLYRGRIFGLFERLHAQNEFPGTGIGLAIVSRAAERMGGRVDFESELGKGSRFWIELPPAEGA